MSRTPTMRAARLDLGSGKLVVQDVPRPRPAAGEILVRVAAAGLGRIDVAVARGLVAPGRRVVQELTLGHEVVGTVVAPGAGVNGWPIGRRVFVHPLAQRRGGIERLGVDVDGGWADYLVVPASALLLIPERLPFDRAVAFPASMSTAWSALSRTAGVRPGQGVAIWGAGRLGTHGIQLARLLGAAPLIAVDPQGSARDRALAVGADAALDPASADFADLLVAAGRGRPPDVAVDFAGTPEAQQQMVASLGPGGTAVLVGTSGEPLVIRDSLSFSAGSQRILGHTGSRVPDLAELIRLFEWGRVDLPTSASRTVSMEEAPDLVDHLSRHPGDCLGLVLRPERASETG